MFNECSWDDDNVKTFKFKKLTKGKPKTPSEPDIKISKSKSKQDTAATAKINKNDTSMKPVKRLVNNSKKVPKAAAESSKPSASKEKTSGKNFLSGLRENLKGSRFRYLNEKLYVTSGTGGQKLFNDNPEEFEAYHSGYRHQVEQWPLNPLTKIIGEIRKLPETLVVADFGCGDAMLAQSVKNSVYSIDLVSVKDEVIASDMANTPLKTGTIDIAVYCLSLMGLNLQDFFLEANRVLRMGGLMIIAEISSRFDSIDEFIRNVTKCGFHLERRELTNEMFVFFKFKKQQNVPKDSHVKSFSLKPCLYKKR